MASILLTLTEEQHTKLRHIAKIDERSMAWHLRKAISVYLENQPKEENPRPLGRLLNN